MQYLTDHFSLEELTRSSTAERMGIDNTPPANILPHLMEVAHGLELVRLLLGHPMYIDSGYRCEELNTAIHGSKTSHHMAGWAADFVCPAFGSPFKIVQEIAKSDIIFDQCIQEGTWVHISFAHGYRREILTAHFGKNGTTYTKGV